MRWYSSSLSLPLAFFVSCFSSSSTSPNERLEHASPPPLFLSPFSCFLSPLHTRVYTHKEEEIFLHFSTSLLLFLSSFRLFCVPVHACMRGKFFFLPLHASPHSNSFWRDGNKFLHARCLCVRCLFLHSHLALLCTFTCACKGERIEETLSCSFSLSTALSIILFISLISLYILLPCMNTHTAKNATPSSFSLSGMSSSSLTSLSHPLACSCTRKGEFLHLCFLPSTRDRREERGERKEDNNFLVILMCTIDQTRAR